MKKLMTIIYTLIFIVILGAFLFPVFARPGIYSHRPTAHANMKQLGTGFLIYAVDYDERLPNATSQTTVKSQLNPYVKNDSLWDPIKDTTLPVKFNMNIAGTLSTDKPIGYPKADQTEITLAYALTDPKQKSQGAFITRQDSSAKFIRLPELFDSLQFQIDRTNVTLAPTDYIAPTSEELLKDQVK